MFKKHFNFVAPTVLTRTLYEIKNKKENNELVSVIKSGLIDFGIGNNLYEHWK